MSKNVACVNRGAAPVRSVVSVAFGCLALSACSAGSERFSSFSFGSGYETVSPSTAKAPSSPSAASPPFALRTSSVQSQANAGTGFQLASATVENNGEYQTLSRSTLPPLQSDSQSRVKTADGYGPYNKPPLPDGSYNGPRVYTPYDDAPPPPRVCRDCPERPYDRATAVPTPPPADGPRPFYSPRLGPERRYDREPPAGVYEPWREGSREAPSRDRNVGDNFRNAPNGRREDFAADQGPRQHARERIAVAKPGDTLASIGDRYGIPPEAIAQANGLRTQPLRPGQELLIPAPVRYVDGGKGAVSAEKPCTPPACHVVERGETLAAVAKAHGVSEKRILEANATINPRALKPGQQLTLPVAEGERSRVAQADLALSNAKTAVGKGSEDRSAPPLPAQNGVLAPAVADNRKVGDGKAAPLADASCEASLANPLPRSGNTFRKPLEGMTIAPFGPQQDGSVNEGVTISVPKGTPIKAAENGIVAYVGDELPGFGNLILIRHADEYVTAYAHADEILVKKCDVVKRGQTIAKAGATGDAGQPQLHFEIRKNSKPVDPLPLLGS